MKPFQFIFFSFCLLISLNIQAQQNHFVYIQTDNKQPFYVKFDKKIYSSSASGYLIVSKLKAGFYTFAVGFPKNEWAEQNIRFVVQEKDYGYLLKNFGEKGWGFFNLQTLNVLMADEPGKAPAQPTAAEIKPDTFSNMLSTVVDDPTIKQNEPLKKVVAQQAAIQPQKVVEPVKEKFEIEKKVTVQVAEPINEKVTAILPPPPIIVTPVLKKNTTKSAEGTQIVYVDTASGIMDTISILIPPNNESLVSIPTKYDTTIKLKEKVILPETTAELVAVPQKKDAKFLEIEVPNPNTTVQQNKLDTIVPKYTAKSPMVNSDCTSFASDEDFLKLRKKMAAADNLDNMITTAKKTFKVKCFSTEQIKNLSVLFLKDADKYSFFDAAYPFVSDSHNYQLLQSQLTDAYYTERFKVMIRH